MLEVFLARAAEEAVEWQRQPIQTLFPPIQLRDESRLFEVPLLTRTLVSIGTDTGADNTSTNASAQWKLNAQRNEGSKEKMAHQQHHHHHQQQQQQLSKRRKATRRDKQQS